MMMDSTTRYVYTLDIASAHERYVRTRYIGEQKRSFAETRMEHNGVFSRVQMTSKNKKCEAALLRCVI